VRNQVAPRGSTLWLAGAVLIAPVLLVASAAQDKSSSALKPIVVMVQLSQGHLNYKVNSRTTQDLLRTLGQSLEERGQDYPVVVLLDWDSPVSQIFDVPGIASKAGFKSVRTFVFDSHDEKYMSEIQVGAGVPFSTNPGHP
jgi:biopolymer transport protein ExbD